jgi:hypothetical protein
LRLGNRVREWLVTMLLKIMFLNYVFKLFWCEDIKNNFLKIKNFILIYFEVKSILNCHRYYNPK